MYGIFDLKQRLAVTNATVECPVVECPTVVSRNRRGRSLRHGSFFCAHHRIYISPSTWEYADENDNLLWGDPASHRLLASIKRWKRESRLVRDNSEDALTWNVFRYFEMSGLLGPLLSSLCSHDVAHPVLSYWSYSAADNNTLPTLAATRKEFGEPPRRSSEPDLIIQTDKEMFWIEAKLSATNRTTPSQPEKPRAYATAGNEWFNQVFVSDYRTVAIEERRYELMRLWLLGTWAAAASNRDFYLINLVRTGKVERRFNSLIAAVPHACFMSITWEQLHDWVRHTAPVGRDRDRLIDYLANKTAGYRNGRLAPAFPSLAATEA